MCENGNGIWYMMDTKNAALNLMMMMMMTNNHPHRRRKTNNQRRRSMTGTPQASRFSSPVGHRCSWDPQCNFEASLRSARQRDVLGWQVPSRATFTCYYIAQRMVSIVVCVLTGTHIQVCFWSHEHWWPLWEFIPLNYLKDPESRGCNDDGSPSKKNVADIMTRILGGLPKRQNMAEP